MITVITPTWHRPMQLARCMASVARQTRPCEHVIVSDGPDPLFQSAATVEFARQMAMSGTGYEPRLHALPEHDPGEWWGRRAKAHGARLALGDLLCFLDDDDEITVDHLAVLETALELHPGAGFAFTRHVVGPPFEHEEFHGELKPDGATIFTPGVLMLRRELLEIASWRHLPITQERDMAERWIAAGVGWAAVNRVTVRIYQHRDYGEDGYPPGRTCG